MALGLILMVRYAEGEEDAPDVVRLIDGTPLIDVLVCAMSARCAAVGAATLRLMDLGLRVRGVAAALLLSAPTLLRKACIVCQWHAGQSLPSSAIMTTTMSFTALYMRVAHGASADLLCIFMTSPHFLALLLAALMRAGRSDSEWLITAIANWVGGRRPQGDIATDPMHQQRQRLFARLSRTPEWSLSSDQVTPEQLLCMFRHAEGDARLAYVVFRLATALSYDPHAQRSDVVAATGVDLLRSLLMATADASSYAQVRACMQGLRMLLVMLQHDRGAPECSRVLAAAEAFMRGSRTDRVLDVGSAAMLVAVHSSHRQRSSSFTSMVSLAATTRKVLGSSESGMSMQHLSSALVTALALADDSAGCVDALALVAGMLLPTLVTRCAKGEPFADLLSSLRLLHDAGLSHLAASTHCVSVLIRGLVDDMTTAAQEVGRRRTGLALVLARAACRRGGHDDLDIDGGLRVSVAGHAHRGGPGSGPVRQFCRVLQPWVHEPARSQRGRPGAGRVPMVQTNLCLSRVLAGHGMWLYTV